MEPALPQCALHPSVVAQQACPRCGNFACQACLLPGPDGRGLCVTCDARDGAREVPWDQRARLGTISAFVKTCWATVAHPVATLERASPEGTVGSSLWFAVLATFTTYLTTGLVYAAIGVAMMGVYLFGADQSEKTLTPLTTGGISLLVGFIFVATVLLFGIGAVLLLSLLDHAVLRMVGARPRSYQVTLRAHALSMGPCLAGLVPFCGLYAVPIWALVVRVFAYRGMHRISTGQAVVGALVVPGILVFLAVASWVAIFAVAAANGSL